MEYGFKKTEDGWKGSNSRIWANEDELKKMLRDEFKKNGLKVSVRSRRSGYLTALDFTMKMSSKDIASEVEFRKAKKSVWNVSMPYTRLDYPDEYGCRKYIDFDDFYKLSSEEQKVIEEKVWSEAYRNGVDRIKSGFQVSDYIVDYLTPEGKSKFRKMREIVASFNRDESDIMTDYFDRDIYDDYYLKVS